MRVTPLAHASDVDKILAQQLLVLAVTYFVCPIVSAPSVVNPFPQFKVAAEFALVVVKLGVLLVGLGLRFHGAVTHVLHAHGTGNDQHFLQRIVVTGFQNHPAHTRVQWQAGEFLACSRQFIVVVHRAQFGQQLITIGDGATRWLFDERKVFHHAQAQALHAQDHTGQ